jgi:hypothetical protein
VISKEIDARILGVKEEDEKVKRIFFWINNEFEWVETDYVERTVEEILIRKAGNCAEQTKVVEKVLNYIGIKTRWVLEINSQPESMERQSFSKNLVEKDGDFYSIFGWNHNDHRWLEYYNNNVRQWEPIDTAFGVLGLNHWLKMRLSFNPESIPTSQKIIPFCIAALDSNSAISEVLSNFYLIDQFDKHYNGVLSRTTVWKEWEILINQLTNLGIATYRSQNNLHKHQDAIKKFTNLYSKLKQEVLTIRVL